jgi:aldoxime dehydratase
MPETQLESAIPDALRGTRQCPRRTPGSYTPPYPSYVARFSGDVGQVVMAYFGVQYSGERTAAVDSALQWLLGSFAEPDGPRSWDRAQYVDGAGHLNIISIAYWDDPTAHARWRDAVGDRWLDSGDVSIGRFIESISPTVDRYETLFSAPDRREGIGVIAEDMSGEIEEHAYWGGVRDRIALGQFDTMKPSGVPGYRVDGDVVRVIPQENICLIRSGQDWTDAPEAERDMYLGDVEPSLRAGMDFLAGPEGPSIGCLTNRYMTVLDPDGARIDKTFGMSWWRSLADLERWAQSHPTHLAIFGAAMKYLQTMGPAANLKLYHEVSVATAGQQRFEYRGCHPSTGMLAVAKPQVAS